MKTPSRCPVPARTLCLAWLLAAAACADEAAGPAERGQISLAVQLPSALFGLEGGVSTLALARLRVGPPGSPNPEVVTGPVAPTDSAVLFDLTLERGTYRFAAELESNNNVVLYSDTVDAVIERSGFVVELNVEPRNAVMVARVESVNAVLGPDGSFVEALLLVRNVGSLPLTLESASADVPTDGIDLFCGDQGTLCTVVAPGDTASVIVQLAASPPPASFLLSLHSNVGTAALAVELPTVALTIDDVGFTRTHRWTIDKSAGPFMFDALADTTVIAYTVAVAYEGSDSSLFAAAGALSIANPFSEELGIDAIDVQVPGVDSVTLTCPTIQAFPVSLPGGASTTCGYVASLPDPTNRFIGATIDFGSRGRFIVSDLLEFGNAAVSEVAATVTIQDILDHDGTSSTKILEALTTQDSTFVYEEPVACGDTLHNLAAIIETGDSDRVDLETCVLI